ncbi:MAG: nicotinate-nucleotide adenylyltransferase [Bacteroidia bacterium]|nr:nicotinate-nucleotide adenylyltransferase [Bacteroidia bacterium]
MKKAGLFFGSFNPIHIGHLAIANYLAEFTELEQIWFIISPHNPFKKKENLLAAHHRYHLVSLAIEDYPQFKASNIEFNLPQPSYTINTLTYLSGKYNNYEFALIVGSDSLATFHKWKNFEQILKNYLIMVYPRHNEFINPYNAYQNVRIVDAPMIEISSSFIRKAIKEKKDIRFFLSEKVYQYITEMNFYKK